MGKSRISLLDNCDNIINPPAPANRFSMLRVSSPVLVSTTLRTCPPVPLPNWVPLSLRQPLWSGIMRSRKPARKTPAAIAHLAAGAKEK